MLNHKLNPHIPNEAAKIKNFYLIAGFQNFEELRNPKRRFGFTRNIQMHQ